MKKNLKSALLFGMATAALTLSSCGGGGGGGGSSYGAYTSPFVSVDSFLSGLNNADDASFSDESYVVLYTDETIRSAEVDQENWFVIWDSKYNEHKAVSLEYIRSIVYYDYFRNSTGLAEEFRAIETDDIFNGDVNGDFFGDDYEVVDYDSSFDVFVGRNSGFEYEDEDQTTDVSLMEAESTDKGFLKRAAKISYLYGINIDKAMSLTTISYKAEAMKKKSGGATLEDLNAIASNVTHLVGTTPSQVVKDIQEGREQEMAKSFAKKLGSNNPQKLQADIMGLMGM